MKAMIQPLQYEIICCNPFGVDSKENVEVYNRRINLEKCKKCNYHKNFDLQKMQVNCNYKLKNEK